MEGTRVSNGNPGEKKQKIFERLSQGSPTYVFVEIEKLDFDNGSLSLSYHQRRTRCRSLSVACESVYTIHLTVSEKRTIDYQPCDSTRNRECRTCLLFPLLLSVRVAQSAVAMEMYVRPTTSIRRRRSIARTRWVENDDERSDGRCQSSPVDGLPLVQKQPSR